MERWAAGAVAAAALLLAVSTPAAHAIDVADPERVVWPDSADAPSPDSARAPADSTGGRAPAPAAAAPDSDHVDWPEAAEAPPPPNPLQRATGTVKTTVGDAWHVYSSPARIHRRSAVVLGAVVATAGLLYVYDEDLLRAVQRNDRVGGVRQFVDVGDAVEPVGIMERTMRYYAMAFALGTVIDFDALQAVSGEIIESHLIGAGLRVAFRPLVGRARPVDSRGSQDFRIGEGRSFPSGHTSVFFELATIVSHHGHSLPVTIAAYGAATAGAIQRIDAGGHWPSDVFLSAVSGTLIARTVIRRSEARKSELEPYGTWVRGGPQLGVRIRY